MDNTGSGSIELQAHAGALSEAIRDGRPVPAGALRPARTTRRRLLARHGRRGRHHGRATKDHHQLAGSRRPGPQPLPCSPPVLVPAVLAKDGDHLVAGQRACGSPADNVRLRPNRDAPGNAVSDFGSEAGAATRPQIRSGAVTVVTPNGVNCAYAAYQRPCTGGGGVRDEEAAGSNPATPTRKHQIRAGAFGRAPALISPFGALWRIPGEDLRLFGPRPCHGLSENDTPQSAVGLMNRRPEVLSIAPHRPCRVGAGIRWPGQLSVAPGSVQDSSSRVRA